MSTRVAGSAAGHCAASPVDERTARSLPCPCPHSHTNHTSARVATLFEGLISAPLGSPSAPMRAHCLLAPAAAAARLATAAAAAALLVTAAAGAAVHPSWLMPWPAGTAAQASTAQQQTAPAAARTGRCC